MKKKLLALVLAVVLIVSLVPISALAATCDHDDDGEPLVYLTPDCANEGEAYATCSVCGTPDFDNIIKLEKDPTVHNPVDCKCDLHTCDDDGEPLVYLTPDCANEGEAYATCSVCGTPNFDSIIKLEKDPTVHNPVDCECDLHTCDDDGEPLVYLTPDCANKGAAYATCSVCGTPDFENVIELEKDPTVHNPVDCECDLHTCDDDGEPLVYLTPDCANKGAAYATCSVCGTPDFENVIELEKDPTVHNPVDCECEDECEHDYIVFGGATPNCIHGAEDVTYICTKCGDITDPVDLPVDPNNHNWYEAAKVEPNCKYDGSVVKICSDCGKEVTEKLEKDPTNHNWYDAATVEPNCKYDGSIVKKCSDCGAEVTEILPKTDDHEWYVAALVEPNCEHEGAEYYMCSVCGAEGEIKVLEKKHNWYVAALVEPNCKYEGKEYYMCADCGAEGEVKTLPKTDDHEWYVAALVEPNCKYEGAEYYMCSVCGAEGEVKVLAKTEDHVYEDGICTICGAEEPVEEPEDPTEPEVDPTEPEVDPTEPEVDPTEPEDPKPEDPKPEDPKPEDPKPEEPTEKPTEKPADPELDDVPKTGDNTVMILATMTGIGMMAALAFVFGKKRIAG